MAIKETLTFLNATGEIRYNMTNDYMFRYILQTNEKVLRGLIASLLHINPQKIRSLELKNPIRLGERIDHKEFILDIRVVLDDEKILNLEMQVRNWKNWRDRSLLYQCRAFGDQIKKGQEYETVLPVIQVCFLDFPLEPEEPEFYATYQLLNVKTHGIYSDKFIISVVDLTHIELATEEDRAYGIDYWARLFKAKTWEELKTLAKDNEYLQEAANAVYVANEDEIVMEMCRAREDAERMERTLIRDRDQAFAERDEAFAERDAAFSKLDEAFTERDEAFAERDEAFTQRNEAVQKSDQLQQEVDKLLARIKELEKQ